MTFIEAEINNEGFDQNFEQNISNSILEDHTGKGIAYDGFTYFKPEFIREEDNKDENKIESIKE